MRWYWTLRMTHPPIELECFTIHNLTVTAATKRACASVAEAYRRAHRLPKRRYKWSRTKLPIR